MSDQKAPGRVYGDVSLTLELLDWIHNNPFDSHAVGTDRAYSFTAPEDGDSELASGMDDDVFRPTI